MAACDIPRRNRAAGFSIAGYIHHASANVTASPTSDTGIDVAPVARKVAVKTTRCNRYSEYESAPVKRTQLRFRMRNGPPRG